MKKQKIGILLHRDFQKNVLITYLINIFLFMFVISLLDIFGLSINVKIPSLFIGVTLFTLIEMIIKYPIYLYFYKEVIYSGGIIGVLIQIGVLKIVELSVKNFDFIKFGYLVLFSIVFSSIRMVLIYIIRKYTYEIEG